MALSQDELDALAIKNSDSWKRQADTGSALLTQIQQQAALLNTPDQENWLKLFELCLRTRLGPSQITSTTTNAVLDDIVQKAYYMTEQIWPTVKSRLSAL